MWAIVKFKGQEPCFFGISNAGHAHRLSTMAGVEWVCSAVVAFNGTICSEDDSKIADSTVSRRVVKAWVPGDPDPLEKYRLDNAS